MPFGRGDRIRTCDHLVPNQVRYRTALRPVLVLRCKDIYFFLFHKTILQKKEIVLSISFLLLLYSVLFYDFNNFIFLVIFSSVYRDKYWHIEQIFRTYSIDFHFYCIVFDRTSQILHLCRY